MRVNISLEDHVKKNIGGTLVFNNGCWIDLTEEDGMFWGITRMVKPGDVALHVTLLNRLSIG